MAILDIYEDEDSAFIRPDPDKKRLILDERWARQYYAQNYLLENIGAFRLQGPPMTFDGVEYIVEVGQRRLVPLGFIYHLLGDPHIRDPIDRRDEHDRLRHRWGIYNVPSHQDTRAAAARRKEQGFPDLGADVDPPVPQIKVIDPATDLEENPGGGWPFYHREARLEDSEKAKLSALSRVEQLEAEVAQLRAERETEKVEAKRG